MQDTTERTTKAETRNLQWRRSPETEIGVSRARSSAMAGSWPRKRGTLHQRSEVQSELQNQCMHAYVSRSPSEVLSGRESVGPGISKGSTFSYQVERIAQDLSLAEKLSRDLAAPRRTEKLYGNLAALRRTKNGDLELYLGPGSPKEDGQAVRGVGSLEEDGERHLTAPRKTEPLYRYLTALRRTESCTGDPMEDRKAVRGPGSLM